MTKLRGAVFDAYGTLLDVHAAMAKHAARPGGIWPRMGAEWRQKQLEYSWVRSLAGPTHHRDFWRLTREPLAWGAFRHQIEDQAVMADILSAYRRLDTYPDAPRRPRDRGTLTAVLSNGEPAMLADATIPAGLENLLDSVLSVEMAGVFKPDPRVYRLVTDRMNPAPRDIAFVSSNPWDAFGAHAPGFAVYWLNRTGHPLEYRLHHVATELTDLAEPPPLIT
jgi:2-haloacid dehalogenase